MQSKIRHKHGDYHSNAFCVVCFPMMSIDFPAGQWKKIIIMIIIFSTKFAKLARINTFKTHFISSFNLYKGHFPLFLAVFDILWIWFVSACTYLCINHIAIGKLYVM